ncbi:alpha/beta hydrolase [Parasphingopyxis sp.]|uniref:alpha/beta fold hydrolase n=1 Tax=Parasphingopyxis sp. TaxID=1920299 RepID=UPI00261057FC|nr:alpha/beta hydrolase [Parasphingopyxis sp.]
MNQVSQPLGQTSAMPSLRSFASEAVALVRAVRKRGVDHAVAQDFAGDGRPVIVLPGFLASDQSTTRLRRTLEAAGYAAHGWGHGVNLRLSAQLFGRMNDAVLGLADVTGQRVALVGWSLGGLYARELAKVSPQAVRQVITLGSPFSGDPRHNRVWRLYEMIARHPVDKPPIDVRLHEKPPVPTTALWSRRDGVIPGDCARGAAGEADRTIELDCRHMDFASDRRSLAAILQTLAR